MNKLLKTTMLAAAGIALASQAAQAQVNTPNDIILTLSSSAATSDYIIDLGQASTLFGQTSVVNLSGDLNSTTYANTFGANPVTMGAVGGNETLAVAGSDLFVTQLRSGTPPNNMAGSSLGGQTFNNAGAALIANGLALGVVAQSSSASWTANTANWFNNTAINPGSVISGTTFSEDVYGETEVQGGTAKHPTYTGIWTYEGYLTFNSSSDALSFTSADVASAVPEPGTYGVIAGAGLLLLCLGGQLRRKTA